MTRRRGSYRGPVRHTARRLVSQLLVAGAAAWSCTPTGSKPASSGDGTPSAVADASPTPPATPAPPALSPARAPETATAPTAADAAPASVAPSPDPVETIPDVTALVRDLAVAMMDGRRPTLYHDDMQTAVAAAWARADDFEVPRALAGATLHGICADGVADWQVEIQRRHAVLVGKDGAAQRGLCLMTKTRQPSPRARLEARALARPVADVKPLRRWVTGKLGRAMTAVGEVRGVFGGGVDRIVVFKPVAEIDFNEEVPHGDVALLVASATPHGLLPFADYDDDPQGVCADLQIGAVFDVDGDGIEEILWLGEDLKNDGSGPLLRVSYFAGGEHRVHDVLRKSYSRVTEFGGTHQR